MIAVIYARVSTSAGKQDTERQVKELTEFAKEYNIEIAKVFQDYQSGATPNSERRFLQECLRYCTVVNKNVNCVLMSEVSRLGRDVWEMTELAKFFHDHHLNVYFLRENLSMFNKDSSENTLFTILFSLCSLLCSASLPRMNEQPSRRDCRAATRTSGTREGRLVEKKEASRPRSNLNRNTSMSSKN